MYNYKEQRAELFTEPGLVRVMRIRDKIMNLIKVAGAFRLQEAGINSWEDMAAVDYLAELGEIVKVFNGSVGQYAIYTSYSEKYLK